MHHENAGKLILRVVLGFVVLLHGIHKLTGGVDWLDGALGNAGLPGFLKYGVYLGEVVAPLLVIANVWVQGAALVMAVNMLFAIGLAHAGDVFALRRGAWAIELQALFLVGSVAVALLARPGSRG